MDHEAVLRGDLPAMQGQTLYNRLSDFPDSYFLCSTFNYRLDISS